MGEGDDLREGRGTWIISKAWFCERISEFWHFIVTVNIYWAFIMLILRHNPEVGINVTSHFIDEVRKTQKSLRDCLSSPSQKVGRVRILKFDSSGGKSRDGMDFRHGFGSGTQLLPCLNTTLPYWLWCFRFWFFLILFLL